MFAAQCELLSPGELAGQEAGPAQLQRAAGGHCSPRAWLACPSVMASCLEPLKGTPGPLLLGFAFQVDPEMLILGTSCWVFPLSFFLPKDLLWTRLLFPLHRHLHQSGALTMEGLPEPPLDPVENMEEDIADKVGPGPGRSAVCRRPTSGCLPSAAAPWCTLRGAGHRPGKRWVSAGDGGALRATQTPWS